MTRVLVIHNIFWSHYKAAVFSALDRIIRSEFEWKVVQIALTEKSRVNLGDADHSIHQYPYTILFNTTYQETKLQARINRMLDEIREFGPDLVVMPGYNDLAYVVVMLWAKAKGITVISTADSTEYDHPRQWHKEFVKKLLLKLPDGFLCYGSRAKGYLSLLGVDEKKIFIRVQATDNALYRQQFLSLKAGSTKPHSSQKKFNFIYVGRLLKSKRVDVILTAFAMCLSKTSEGVDWGVVIVGDGEEYASLQHQSQQLGITDHVYFEGGVSWTKLPAYYANADVFVFPSASETWGLVINEAMLCELPVLASERCGATPDLVLDGITGFSFPPEDASRLSELMLKFILQEIDAKQMGHAALNRIQDYSPEVAASQMLSAFRQLKGVK